MTARPEATPADQPGVPSLAAGGTEYAPRIARGAAITFAGTIVGGALAYLFQVIAARSLGTEGYGLFSLGYAAYNVAAKVATLGMANGVVRYVSIYYTRRDPARLKGTLRLSTTLALVGGIGVGLGLAALSDLLATRIFHVPELAGALRGFAVAIPFFALTAIWLAATQGLQIMRYRAYVRGFFEPSFRIVLAAVLFLVGWRLWGAIFAFVVAVAASAGLALFFYRRSFSDYRTIRVAPRMETRVFLAFSWPLFLSEGLGWLEIWTSSFLLGAFATPGAVGVFTAAYRTALIVQGILFSFSSMFAPIIAQLYQAKESETLATLFKMVTKWIFTFGLPATLLMVLFPNQILSIFGADYRQGTVSLLILAASQFIQFITGPLAVMINMSGRSKLTLLNTAVQFLVQIALGLWLIPRYGIVGAAFVRLCSVAFLRGLQLLQVRFLLGMHPFRATFLKPIVAGGLAFLVVAFLRFWAVGRYGPLWLLAAGALLFLTVYALVLYRLGFDEEDRLVLGRLRLGLG